MPILHMRLDKATTVVELPIDLTAQKMVLRKATILKDTTASQSLGGSVMIDIPWINSFEMVSNITSKHLVIPLDETSKYNDTRFNLNLNGEHVNRRFTVQSFKSDGITPAVFGTGNNGDIKSIDLFFEYQTNHQFF